MRKSGEIVQWNDERGFGFIRGSDGSRRFMHIRSIKRARRRPEPGDAVTYLAASGEDGRPVAKSVVLVMAPHAATRPVAAPSRQAPAGDVARPRYLAAAAIVGLAVATGLLEPALGWVPVAYLVLGIAAIAVYWADKSAAEGGRWRVSEASLHLLDLIGGIAGGLLAQALLRHKNRKRQFAATTWAIAVVHILAQAALLAAVVIY